MHKPFILDTRETTLLKGIGILMIVLHNFFHNLPPKIGENEFTFSIEVTKSFINAFLAFPNRTFESIPSYFGHYGVQLFIFLSAYGLTKSNISKPTTHSTFLLKRFGKIYLTFVSCVLLYVGLGVLKSTALNIPIEEIINLPALLYKLLLISNLVPHQSLTPVGPWWFIPFILQLYLIAPFLISASRNNGGNFLLMASLLCMLIEVGLNDYLVPAGLNLNFNFIGHMSVICLGIYAALTSNNIISSKQILPIALLVVVAGMFYKTFWYIADVSMTILLLWIALGGLRKLSPLGKPYRIIMFYGSISFPLFLVNGFLRSPFHDLSVNLHTWWMTIIISIGSLIFATIFSMLLLKMDNFLRIYYLNLFNRVYSIFRA